MNARRAAANRVEVHDADTLGAARAVLDACTDARAMGEAVKAAVARNARWRGEQCINLLAPEAPTSPAVRALLSSEIGTRAAEGHIGPVNRWFAGTRHIDELEALCVELLKRYFRCNYADHRLCASMIGNAAVYTALSEPGDIVMSAAQPLGGHSSNRVDGPAGALNITDSSAAARRGHPPISAYDGDARSATGMERWQSPVDCSCLESSRPNGPGGSNPSRSAFP